MRILWSVIYACIVWMFYYICFLFYREIFKIYCTKTTPVLNCSIWTKPWENLSFWLLKPICLTIEIIGSLNAVVALILITKAEGLISASVRTLNIIWRRLWSFPGKASRTLVESGDMQGDSTCVREAKPGKLDIKRREPGVLFYQFTRGFTN